MVFRKLLVTIAAISAFSAVLSLTQPSALAGGLLNNAVNTVTRTATTAGTPLGPSGPTGPSGPLISSPRVPVSPNSGLGIGSSGPIVSNANGSRTHSDARPRETRIEGTVNTAKRPGAFQKPLQTTVTEVTNDSVTIATSAGPATLKLPPGSVARSGLLVGSKVTVVPNSNGISVRLQLTDVTPKPFGGIYVGTVRTAAGTTVTLHFRDGAVRSFTATPRLVQMLNAVKGKTVALESSDGSLARKLLTVRELNHVLDSLPKIENRYIGRIVSATNSLVVLDVGKGQVQTLRCSTCTGGALHGISLLHGLAVYAIGDPQGRLVDLAPIPNGTRIVGQVVSAERDAVSIMLGTGNVTTLACACATILPSLGNISVGDPIIADLDQNAGIASLTRFPDSGRLIGQVVGIDAKRLDLKLPSGQVQSFSCNCFGGPFDAALLRIGNTIAVILNGDAQVASINAPTATSPTAATTSKITVPLPCGRPSQKRMPSAGRAQTKSPCAEVGERNTLATSAHGRAYFGNSMTPPLGCSSSEDSSGIFIAVHDGRTHRPVRDAAVTLSGPASIALLSPASGYIELNNAPAGTYRLRVRKAGYGEAGTSEFAVSCKEGVRVDANLRTLPQLVRVIRVPKRQLALLVRQRQKQQLNCVYAPKTRQQRLAKMLRNGVRYRTSHGYYTCGVRKARFSSTSYR